MRSLTTWFSGCFLCFLISMRRPQLSDAAADSVYSCDFGPTCFLILPSNQASWDVARQTCTAQSSSSTGRRFRLLAITSDEIQNGLQTFLGRNDLIDQNVWIGASRSAEASQWTWVNGTMFNGNLGPDSDFENHTTAFISQREGNVTSGSAFWLKSNFYICQFEGIRCPTFYPNDSLTYQNNNKCYVRFQSSRPWHSARTRCLHLGGDLLTDIQKDFIKWFLPPGIDYWIGLQKEPWTWIDTDTNNNRQNVAVGKTRFIGGRPELNKCIAVSPGSGFAWDSSNCYDNNRFVCEEVFATGTPTTTRASQQPGSSVSITAEQSNGQSTLATGPLIGIIIGCVAFYVISMVVVGLAVVYCIQRSRRTTGKKALKKENSLPPVDSSVQQDRRIDNNPYTDNIVDAEHIKVKPQSAQVNNDAFDPVDIYDDLAQDEPTNYQNFDQFKRQKGPGYSNVTIYSNV